MAYIKNDGTVVSAEPWPRKLMTIFLGIFHMFFMFFRSLASPVMNMLGSQSDDSYKRDYRPGSGPPRPPRRMGRPNTGSSINTPGPIGGCGCG